MKQKRLKSRLITRPLSRPQPRPQLTPLSEPPSRPQPDIRTVVRAAIAVSITITLMLFFRGPLSLAAALIIPAVLVLFSRSDGLLYDLLITAGLLVAVLLFFQTQAVFVLAYLILSHALKFLFVRSDHERLVQKIRSQAIRVMIYLLIVAAVLYISIRLTEIIFLVPLHQMMLRLSGHNPWLYLGILWLESLLISFFNILMLKSFSSRVASVRVQSQDMN